MNNEKQWRGKIILIKQSYYQINQTILTIYQVNNSVILFTFYFDYERSIVERLCSTYTP